MWGFDRTSNSRASLYTKAEYVYICSYQSAASLHETSMTLSRTQEMKYDFRSIEAKWQKYWSENQVFKAKNGSEKPKYYVLDMFPYPSGAGLHVGHPLGYIASDIYARYKRHKGFEVLHPMGYDSFGLPAEQYAIQTGQHPARTTERNIDKYRSQLDRLGLSYDWSREVRTSDPSYYHWTQWVFIQLFHSWYDQEADRARPIGELIKWFEDRGTEGLRAARDEDAKEFTASDWHAMDEESRQQTLLQYRLTYLADTEVNWCPELGTVLANDEVVNGVSERGGHPVVRKKMTQWSMRITAYAQRLLDGLNEIDWPTPLKDAQKHWIGRSEGADVAFGIEGHDKVIHVFTTRPDTLFGVSFMTLAPEHEWVHEICTDQQRQEVEAYVEASSRRSERDRLSDVKSISGVFTGAYALHPISGERIPIWIGDYVLASYGTGAVMAVPCGDQRDYLFARHFGLEIPNIFEGVDISEEAYMEKSDVPLKNSDFLNGLAYEQAFEAIIDRLESEGKGTRTVNYRLRDAVFSRQRYWGEPFPIYYKNGLPYTLPEECLPLPLPEVQKYLPTEDGDPPLGNAEIWAWDEKNRKVVDTDRIDHQQVFPLELNTMPGWAGSSQYFNRYMDPRNGERIFGEDAIQYWKEVDLYIGGSEHATGHLLYSRFWQHFLYDLGYVPRPEYARKLINQGMITGTSALAYRVRGTRKYVSRGLKDEYPDVDPIHVDVNLVNASDELDLEAVRQWQPEFGDAEFEREDGVFLVGREIEKMSKRWYNVVSPDTICDEYGADSLRLFEMFLGPLDQSKPWNTAGITGVFSFLKKLWKLYQNPTAEEPTADHLRTLHHTIRKVEEDLAGFSFNTSVSNFMICVNELTSQKCTSRSILEPLVILISPYAPHIAEELWSQLGHTGTVAYEPFPEFEPKYVEVSEKEYPISFNGKMRFTLTFPLDMNPGEIEDRVLAHEKTREYLGGREPKKVIVVPGKIVNIVG